MSDKNRPYIKLVENVPVIITSDFDALTAQSYPDKFNEGQVQYLYLVTVLESGDPELVPTGQYAWYLKPKQHDVMLNAGVKKGEKYRVVKKKAPGDKWPKFTVTPVEGSSENTHKVQEQSTQANHGSLEPVSTQEYDNELDAFMHSPPLDEQPVTEPVKTPINANKQSGRDGQTLGMCYKIACEQVGMTNEDGFLNLLLVNKETIRLYDNFLKLMHE